MMLKSWTADLRLTKPFVTAFQDSDSGEAYMHEATNLLDKVSHPRSPSTSPVGSLYLPRSDAYSSCTRSRVCPLSTARFPLLVQAVSAVPIETVEVRRPTPVPAHTCVPETFLCTVLRAMCSARPAHFGRITLTLFMGAALLSVLLVPFYRRFSGGSGSSPPAASNCAKQFRRLRPAQF